jgi:hypothetical protein
MNKVLSFILAVIAWIVTIVTFICLDLPLKILAIIFILLVGTVCAILYPLTKHFCAPRWFEVIFDYSAKPKMLISKKVYKLWTED